MCNRLKRVEEMRICSLFVITFIFIHSQRLFTYKRMRARFWIVRCNIRAKSKLRNILYIYRSSMLRSNFRLLTKQFTDYKTFDFVLNELPDLLIIRHAADEFMCLLQINYCWIVHELKYFLKYRFFNAFIKLTFHRS